MRTKPEKMRTILNNMFSLKADTASHEEIRDRLLSGGQITGTNMCVLICAMVIVLLPSLILGYFMVKG